MNQQHYQKYINSSIHCATICNHCAISCLEEKDVQNLIKCIKLDLECAVICRATAELLNSDGVYSQQITKICADICNACADECEKHAANGMEHCKECAEACRATAKILMEVFENADYQDKSNDHVQHEEFAILSRASSELLSFGSSYFDQISELSSIASKAASETIEQLLNLEKEHALSCEYIATESKQHLKDYKKESDINATPESNDQTEKDKEKLRKQKENAAALLAASLWRSPVHHARRHSIGGLFGSYANMGTNVSYEEEDV